MLQWYTTCVIVLFLATYAVVQAFFKPVHRRISLKKHPWKFPPGPRGIPIMGNLRQMMKARRDGAQLSSWVILVSHELEHLLILNKLSSLSTFGEMTTLQMGSRTWVLLNSGRVVQEIIAKRGHMTSERPYFPIASGLVSRGQRTVLRQTAKWTEGRRVMHSLLNNSTALKSYGEWIELESVQLLAGYLRRPQQWYSHHYRYSNSVIHRIVLGQRLLKSTPELDHFQRVGVQFIASINSSLIDFFPRLASLPEVLQFWRERWISVGQFHYDVFSSWWKPVKEAIANGTAPASFVRDTLLHQDTKFRGTDEEAMYLAMSVIGAGSDNPRLTMNTFVMAVLCHPDVFQKTREEADRICGIAAERLPNLDDQSNMPYACAVLKEVLRWRPVMPLIPQHRLTEDLEFESFRFPKGTDFVINYAAVSQDFEEPDEFKPERWLDGQEQNISHGIWQFGGGRRVCVGYKIAQQELFLAISRLVYCFDYVAVNLDNLIS